MNERTPEKPKQETKKTRQGNGTVYTTTTTDYFGQETQESVYISDALAALLRAHGDKGHESP